MTCVRVVSNIDTMIKLLIHLNNGCPLFNDSSAVARSLTHSLTHSLITSALLPRLPYSLLLHIYMKLLLMDLLPLQYTNKRNSIKLLYLYISLPQTSTRAHTHISKSHTRLLPFSASSRPSPVRSQIASIPRQRSSARIGVVFCAQLLISGSGVAKRQMAVWKQGSAR